jgi:hypothetical protein
MVDDLLQPFGAVLDSVPKPFRDGQELSFWIELAHQGLDEHATRSISILESGSDELDVDGIERALPRKLRRRYI